jgi:hypothetical protein
VRAIADYELIVDVTTELDALVILRSWLGDVAA